MPEKECINIDETIADDDINLPDEEVIALKVREKVRKILPEILNTREISVLTKRRGLDGNSEQTLEDVGFEMGFFNERARQIEKKALKKIEHHYHYDELKRII